MADQGGARLTGPGTGPDEDLVGDVLAWLRSQGHEPEPAGRDRWVVRSESLPLEPVLLLPEAEFREYVEDLARRMDSSFGEALSLTMVHFDEEFGTDHGEGMTYLRSVRFQRDRTGVLRFDIEQDVPPWR